MVNYSNAKIYKIESISSGLVYYGSTCSPLAKRMGGHRSHYRAYLRDSSSRVHTTSFKVLEYKDARILLVESVECKSKKELNRLEGKYIKENPCVNKQVAGQTRAEYARDWSSRPGNKERIAAFNKKSYEKNKEKNHIARLLRDRAYYQKNKERVKLKNKTEKYTCVCGSNIRTRQRYLHEKSKKHLSFKA